MKYSAALYDNLCKGMRFECVRDLFGRSLHGGIFHLDILFLGGVADGHIASGYDMGDSGFAKGNVLGKDLGRNAVVLVPIHYVDDDFSPFRLIGGGDVQVRDASVLACLEGITSGKHVQGGSPAVF